MSICHVCLIVYCMLISRAAAHSRECRVWRAELSPNFHLTVFYEGMQLCTSLILTLITMPVWNLLVITAVDIIKILMSY